MPLHAILTFPANQAQETVWNGYADHLRRRIEFQDPQNHVRVHQCPITPDSLVPVHSTTTGASIANSPRGAKSPRPVKEATAALPSMPDLQGVDEVHVIAHGDEDAIYAKGNRALKPSQLATMLVGALKLAQNDCGAKTKLRRGIAVHLLACCTGRLPIGKIAKAADAKNLTFAELLAHEMVVRTSQSYAALSESERPAHIAVSFDVSAPRGSVVVLPDGEQVIYGKTDREKKLADDEFRKVFDGIRSIKEIPASIKPYLLPAIHAEQVLTKSLEISGGCVQLEERQVNPPWAMSVFPADGIGSRRHST